MYNVKEFYENARNTVHSTSSSSSFPFVQIPVTIGGVEISPGDVIVGDDDGVVVLGSDLDRIRVCLLRACCEKPRVNDTQPTHDASLHPLFPRVDAAVISCHSEFGYSESARTVSFCLLSCPETYFSGY